MSGFPERGVDSSGCEIKQMQFLVILLDVTGLERERISECRTIGSFWWIEEPMSSSRPQTLMEVSTRRRGAATDDKYSRGGTTSHGSRCTRSPRVSLLPAFEQSPNFFSSTFTRPSETAFPPSSSFCRCDGGVGVELSMHNVESGNECRAHSAKKIPLR